MESPLRMISQKSCIVPKKGSYSKAKITPVYNNEPATVVTELKAKVDSCRGELSKKL
jgi:hypothetical protein